MNIQEAIKEVSAIAKQCGYEGSLSRESLEECAKVYLGACDEDGDPLPRLFMRSGKHRATKLNAIQWLLVRTPAFKKWFGKSVVVDENGDPKVMYHGTWKSFSEFKPSSIKLSKVAMTLWSGPGYYFTDQEDVAKIYAGDEGNNIYSVFLRLENPLVVDETGNSEDAGIRKADAVKIFLDGDNTQWLDSGLAADLARMDEEDGVKGKGKHFYKGLTRKERVEFYVSRLKTDVVKLKTAAQAFGAKSQNKLLTSVCKHTGYDGVIHTITPEVKEWVVYDATSIKSAVGNSGEYSNSKTPVEDEGEIKNNFKEKGNTNMLGFRTLVDSLTKLIGDPSEVKETGMDIVDHLGRHHQPKAIPEGGQYEEEGQYLHGQAKVDAAIRHATSGKRASLLREHVAPLFAGLGYDSATRAKVQKMHEDIRGMSKRELLKGLAKHMKDVKRHADAYNEVKNMSKEDFKAWLEQHPEYKTEMTDRLLNDRRYNGKYDVKGGFHDDGTGKQKHEAWEEAKWSVGAKAMASLILCQEYGDAVHGAPDQIMANMIAHAQEEAPQVEGRGEAAPQEQIEASQTEQNSEAGAESGSVALTMGDIEDAARQFSNHHHISFNPQFIDEMQNFLHQAQRGEIDLTPANQGIRKNDMRFYEDIKAALGEDHPVTQALTRAIDEQRNGTGTANTYSLGANGHLSRIDVSTGHGVNGKHISGLSGSAGNDLAMRIENALRNSNLISPSNFNVDITGANDVRNIRSLDLPITLALAASSGNIGNRYIVNEFASIGGINLSGEITGSADANSIVDIREAVESARRHGKRGIFVPYDLGEEASYGTTGIDVYPVRTLREVTEFLNGNYHIEPSYVDPSNQNSADVRDRINAAMETHRNDNSESELRESNVMSEEVEGEPRDAAEAVANHVDSQAGAGSPQTNVGSNAPTETDLGGNSHEPVYAYTDSNGQAHWIQHNEGGLKAEIHPSEIGAVQAEMRKAFADAGNGVEGAEEYAHALSHFLGRGQDARSPHPGMRQEGLLKHQLADKMQNRLESKKQAYQELLDQYGPDFGMTIEAKQDYDATVKASKTIAEKCGITADMLPVGTNFNHVRTALGAPIRAANPEHQEAVNALHALANPEPAREENAANTTEQTSTVGEPTDSQQTSSTEGIPEASRDRFNTETHNSTGMTPEQLTANSAANRTAAANATPDIEINGGHIHDAIAARYRLQGQIDQLNQQANEAESNGNADEAQRLRDQAVALQNQQFALSHFASRSTGGMANRDDNGNFTHTGSSMEDRMREYLNNAWGRAVERHGDDGAENARGVQGAREAIRTMGGILGFTPEFNGRNVEFRWNGQQNNGVNLDAHISALNEQHRNNTASLTGMSTNSAPERERQVAANAEAGGITPTQIHDLAQRIHESAGGAAQLPVIEEVLTDLANGRQSDRLANMGYTPEQIISTYANQHGIENDPTFQAIRNVVNGANPTTTTTQATTSTRNPTPAAPASATPTAAATPTTQNAANAPAQHTVRLPEMRVNFTDRDLRGTRYDWPARRGQDITAEQITPELARAVAMNLPTGRRDCRHRVSVNDALSALRDPDHVSRYDMDRFIRRYMSGNTNNRHAQRFAQMFNALHPGWIEHREERLAQERANAQREANTRRLDAVAAEARTVQNERVDENLRVNLDLNDVTDAVNRIVNSLGEEHRGQVQSAMDAFRVAGTVPDNARQMLANILPSTHPVMVAVRDADRRQAAHREAQKSEMMRFRVPASDSTNNANRQEAENRGFAFSADERAPFVCNHDIGSHFANCYINTVAQRAQKHGIHAAPLPGWSGVENTNHFAKRQLAYARNFTLVQRDDGTVDSNRIAELRHQMRDGDSISAWSGGHNVLITLQNGQWYKDDGYYGIQAEPLTDAEVAGHMTRLDDVYDAQKRQADAGDRSAQARIAMAKFTARHNLMKEGKTDINAISPAEMEQAIRKAMKMASGSFVIPADAPMLPEEWELLRPA